MHLSPQDKENILDYCLGQLDASEKQRVQGLIDTHPEAQQLHRQIMASLQPLQNDGLLEPCPDALVDKTVSRLMAEAAHTTNSANADQPGPVTLRFVAWQRAVQVAAVAAILVFCASVVLPMANHWRALANQQRCKHQLSGIYKGMMQYHADFNGRFPSVKVASGAPWWRVGDQGVENVSNTRPVWLLAREGYLQPTDFKCPSRKGKRAAVDWASLNVKELRDFPCLDCVDYSFQISCDKSRLVADDSTILMADANPLRQIMPTNCNDDFSVKLNESVLQANSPNHGGHGQSILRGCGGVVFSETRWIDHAGQDDIYSLQEMAKGWELKGCELPSCSTDAFLAP